MDRQHTDLTDLKDGVSCKLHEIGSDLKINVIKTHKIKDIGVFWKYEAMNLYF